MLNHWLETFLQSLGNLGFWGSVVFVFAFAGLSLLGLPLIPFALAGGFLFGMTGGLTGVVIGSTLGAAIGFLLSRYVARERLKRFLGKNPKFLMIDHAIHREGWKIVILLRMCPLPYGLSNYAYGLTNVPFWHYLGATIAGMLPGEIVFVSLGTAGKHMGDIHDSPATKALTALGILALFGVLFMLRRIAGKRMQQMEESN